MLRISKRIFAFLFSLVFVVSLLAMPSEPAKAEDSKKISAPEKLEKLTKSRASDEGVESGVHADPATFEKNFVLSIDQKEYTITEIEKVIKRIIGDNMSDLEKYYTLAIWANKRVIYDSDFWSGGYNFDYYSHQWDSYGAMKEDEKSVCAGIAIFYADLCHAADLPCRYVRTDPEYLDHTINYIPNINGHGYYSDITENYMFMSEYSSNSFEPNIDKAFAYITEAGRCKEKTFDYYEEEYDGEEEASLTSTYIKDFYDVPYANWFNEYALHKNTDKKFGAEYVEKGSGVAGTHYASYKTTLSQKNEIPDIWFLEDFYKDPAAVKTKILNKEFDEQVLNVSGIKQNYDCDTKEELEAAINQDVSVKFFPSSENGEVVAKAANLTKDEDYTVTCKSFDADNHKAKILIGSKGDYSGQQEIEVSLNSATVTKAPVKKKELVYNGRPQKLIEAGAAEHGEMMYALGTDKEVTGDFSYDIPTAVNAGKYYVWYKAEGDMDHENSEIKCMERPASIAPKDIEMEVDDMVLEIGETGTICPNTDADVPLVFTYENNDPDIVSVDANGNVTAKKEGTATIEVICKLKYDTPNYQKPYSTEINVEVLPGDPIDISNAKVKLAKTKFTYNGKVKTPKIKTIKGLKLEAGTDYVAYLPKRFSKPTKNVGTYTIIIIGKGHYTGVTEVTYKINPKGTTLKKVKKAKKAVVVKWKKQSKKMSKSRITGYQIKLATNSKFTQNKKIVNVKGYKKSKSKVNKLKSKTKYFVKIRTYKTVNGKKFFSSWSKVKKVKTK